MAEHALEVSSLADVEKALTAAMKSELQKRFAAAIEAKKHAGESVAAGRRFVHAYAEFIHYVEGVRRSAAEEAPQSAHHASP
jgi:hypothetical protein